MKHAFILATALAFTTIIANAAKTEIDGIIYNLGNGTAEVTHRGDEDDGWMYYSADNLYTGDVVIPDSVTIEGKTYVVNAIGKDAFAGSRYMETLHLPATIGNMGSGLFSLCNSLNSITVDADNPRWFGFRGILYQQKGDDVSIFFAPRAIGGDIELWDGIKEIPDGCFQYNKSVSFVSIPASVTSIAMSAFYECTNLEEIVLPDGLKSIGQYAFEKCNKLEMVNIPGSVTNIGACAFSSCKNLSLVYLNEGLQKIEKMAFYQCGNIIGIQLPSTLTSIGEDAFDGCENLSVVMNNSRLNVVAGSSTHGMVAYYADEVIGGASGTEVLQNGSSANIVYTTAGTAIITGAEGRTYRIFSLDGKILKSGTCTSNCFTIEAEAGKHIIKVE